MRVQCVHVNVDAKFDFHIDMEKSQLDIETTRRNATNHFAFRELNPFGESVARGKCCIKKIPEKKTRNVNLIQFKRKIAGKMRVQCVHVNIDATSDFHIDMEKSQLDIETTRQNATNHFAFRELNPFDESVARGKCCIKKHPKKNHGT